MESVERRREARRDLRKTAQTVHDAERASIAVHAQVTRWEDCYDCAATVLRDTRKALRMPRYPTTPDPTANAPSH